jgi:hypothetical protein
MAAKFMNIKTDWMNTRMTLLNAVSMPEHTKLEYWIRSQKASGFPPIHYWNLLAEDLQEIDRFNLLANGEIHLLAKGLKSLKSVFDAYEKENPTVLMN